MTMNRLRNCFVLILICMCIGTFGSLKVRLKRIEDRQTMVEERLRIIEAATSLESIHRREDTETLFLKMTDISTMLNKSQDGRNDIMENEISETRIQPLKSIQDQRESQHKPTERLLKAFDDEKRVNSRMRRRVQSMHHQIKNNAANTNTIVSLLNVTVPNIEDSIKNITYLLNNVEFNTNRNANLFNYSANELVQSAYNSSKIIVSRIEHKLQTCLLKTEGTANIYKNISNELTKIEKITNKIQKVQLLGIPTSCLQWFHKGVKRSGIFTIHPSFGDDPIPVYCDQETDGGGWTVFQRRQDGSVDFYRNWTEYESGFGKLDGEFWLGNEILSRLTATGKHELRIELDNIDNRNKGFAKYERFSVGSKEADYVLNVEGFSGDVEDRLGWHDGMKFSTKDRDNDKDSRDCAEYYESGWWFNACFFSHLNGLYMKGTGGFQCICWSIACPKCHKYVEMKFRKID